MQPGNEKLVIDILETPEDYRKITYFTFLLLGVGILLPWNSLIMALDFFTVKLPSHDVDFVVSILSNGPLFFTNIIMIVFHKSFPTIKTIVISLCIMIVLNIMLPVLPQVVNSESADWILVFVVIIVMSFVNGIMQSCCYGLVGPFPHNCIASLNTGCALSGLIISFARALTLLIFPTEDGIENGNYFYGAMLYFSLGALGLVVAIVMVKLMINTEFYKYYRQRANIIEHINQQRTSQNEDPKTKLSESGPNELIDSDGEIKSVDTYYSHEKAQDVSIIDVHNNTLVLGYGLVLVYVSSLLMII